MPLSKTQMALGERSRYMSFGKGEKAPGSMAWGVRGKKVCFLKSLMKAKGTTGLRACTAHRKLEKQTCQSLPTEPRPWREAARPCAEPGPECLAARGL